MDGYGYLPITRTPEGHLARTHAGGSPLMYITRTRMVLCAACAAHLDDDWLAYAAVNHPYLSLECNQCGH